MRNICTPLPWHTTLPSPGLYVYNAAFAQLFPYQAYGLSMGVVPKTGIPYQIVYFYVIQALMLRRCLISGT